MRKRSGEYNYQINFLGQLKRNDVNNELHKVDYFIHASAIETFSLVITEALATGTPVIASKVGAIPELINDSNGILCNNTIDDWKIKIIKAISTSYDHEQISKNIISFYSQDSVSLMFKDLYTDFISQENSEK